MSHYLQMFSMILLLSSCSYINSSLGLSDDNLGEELIELGLKSQTGIDVDLTPSSPEK